MFLIQRYQMVNNLFHFHLHMIPRYKGVEVGLGWKMGELTEEDKQDILSKL